MVASSQPPAAVEKPMPVQRPAPADAPIGADSHAAERADLAAAFRWIARLDMHEGVANHLSLAVSADGRRFLINPNSRHFSRVRASELLLLDADDPHTMERPDAPDPTAWAIHGALHRNVPHARCVLHVHPKFGTVLASLADSSMPPIDQNTMRFFGRIAVDEHYEGMGLGDEAERLATVAGDKPIVVMGNHGVMALAASVAQAFDDLYYFERACQTLITAYMSGRPLRVASDEVARRTARQWIEYPDAAELHFAALKEILDRQEPDYRD
jgi:ribulose-5-phosphate 4-epimerase/fuculose-1-phosphate aldolase